MKQQPNFYKNYHRCEEFYGKSKEAVNHIKLHSNEIPLAKTGIYACGVSYQTGVALAKPGTTKQENSMTYKFI